MAPSNSRLKLARAAIRPAMHGKMLLAGASGAGKTFTALTIAEVLVGPEGRILLIDTEKESSLTYADLFRFEHLRWKAPFDPRELAETVLEAGDEYDAVIIDSFTHFWRGKGGTLDIAGGKFTGWADARPAQVDVTEAVLETDCHVICCVRSKMAHVQETNAAGKIVVTKLGMAPEQDDDFEYEVNVSVEIDMQHAMQIGKSRTNAVPVGRVFTAGHAPDFATIYKEWLAGGEPVADHAKVKALVDQLSSIEDRGERLKAKEVFLECFGRPEFILESRLAEATTWVAERVALIAGDAGEPGPAINNADPSGDGDATPPERPSDGSEGPLPGPDAGDDVVASPAVGEVAAAGDGAPPSSPDPAASEPEEPVSCAFCGSTKAKLAEPDEHGQRLCTNQGACEGRRKIRIAESAERLREEEQAAAEAPAA